MCFLDTFNVKSCKKHVIQCDVIKTKKLQCISPLFTFSLHPRCNRGVITGFPPCEGGTPHFPKSGVPP